MFSCSYVYVFICSIIHMFNCSYEYVFICTYIHVFICIYSYMYVFIYVCIHMYIYSYVIFVNNATHCTSWYSYSINNLTPIYSYSSTSECSYPVNNLSPICSYVNFLWIIRPSLTFLWICDIIYMWCEIFTDCSHLARLGSGRRNFHRFSRQCGQRHET